MKKKTLVRLAAISAAAALLLGGCGGSSSPESLLNPKEPVSLRLWHYYNGFQQKALKDLIAEFNDTVGLEKGIIIQEFGQGNVSELTEKIIDSANKKVGSEEIPEIFAAYADTAQQVDELNLVTDLGQYLTEEDLAEYVPGYLEEGYIGNPESLKIFPVAKSTEIMLLNTTDWEPFAQATGASLSDLSTMEGVVRTAKSYYEWTDGLTETPDDGKAFWGRDALANYFIIGCKQFGTEIFEVKDGRVTFHAEEELIRRLWDHYYVPMVNGWFGAYGRFRSDDAKRGKILALVGSSSGSAYFPSEVNINDLDSHPIESVALPAPLFEGGRKVAVQQGAGMVVTKSDPKTEYAATVFLKWFTEEERNIRFSVASGYLPVKTAANDIEKVKAVAMSEEEQEIIRSLEAPLSISLNTAREYDLYTNKAFAGGTKARNVLEYSLSDQIALDLEEIDALTAQGTPRAEAIARYTTDQHFQEWYHAFQAALEDAIR